MSDVDLTKKVEALELILRSIVIQAATQWGDDPVRALDQWQAELSERHPDAAAALNEVFEGAIRQFG